MFISRAVGLTLVARPAACAVVLGLVALGGGAVGAEAGEGAQAPETRALVAVVNGAAQLVQARGEAAFGELRRSGGPYRQGERYVFVLDPEGNMLVHPDPALEGKNTLELKDVDGRPIIRSLIDVATLPGKPEGWYHYRWPVPGALLPRWKSSYVRLATTPAGKRLVVGSGVYDDRMERSFVVDMVKDAVAQIERRGQNAYPLLRDPKGRFVAKDAYVFVVEPNGREVVNPAFPNLEGRNLLELKDTQGKALVREMLETARARGSGWVDYMWPRPGESTSTQKSAFVSQARLNGDWVLVGCGVYLADAPRQAAAAKKLTAPELMKLVRDGSAVFSSQGEKAFPAFREKGSRWLQNDTYFFAWRLDGTRVFHATDRTLEGVNGSGVRDILGRPYGKMFLEVASSPSGEGWVHYMYPEPGDIFPAWKSVFVKRVTFPSGETLLVGSGVYNMQLDKAFIVDVVDRAAALVEARGPEAFPILRDKTGPFVFMDTYVFVDSPEGVELVNPAQPSLEGRNIRQLVDAAGKPIARDYLSLAMRRGSGWVEYSWYRPGQNTLTRKQAYVRKVQWGQQTYVVGSGLYVEEAERAIR